LNKVFFSTEVLGHRLEHTEQQQFLHFFIQTPATEVCLQVPEGDNSFIIVTLLGRNAAHHLGMVAFEILANLCS
jgi:hypothetical protein